MKRHLDIFSGIGGFALAASWAGFETVQFCEIDPFARAVLAKNFPGVPIHDDIRTLGAGTVVGGDIDLLTGGFPCQPFSLAGQRKGQADDRHLWPEMARVIAEVRPRWVLGENTPGLKDLALDDCLHDLEGIGYEAWAVDIPAGAVGAWHRRQRIWILAHAETVLGTEIERSESDGALSGDGPFPSNAGSLRIEAGISRSIEGQEGVADITHDSSPIYVHTHGEQRLQPTVEVCARRDTAHDGGWWSTEPPVGRMVHGFSSRLDQSLNVRRLSALGNAIVPQVAYEIIRLMD